jgi:hypothetical protein
LKKASLDWLINYFKIFYVPLENLSFIQWRHITITDQRLQNLGQCSRRLCADCQRGIFIMSHLKTVTQGLSFSGFIRRTTPFSRLFRDIRGCQGPILTWIHMGPLVFSRLLQHTRGCWGPILTKILRVASYKMWLNLITLGVNQYIDISISTDIYKADDARYRWKSIFQWGKV